MALWPSGVNQTWLNFQSAAPANVCGQRGRNMTVTMTISDQVGVARYDVVWGGATVEIFRGFSPLAWVSSWETSRPP